MIFSSRSSSLGGLGRAHECAYGPATSCASSATCGDGPERLREVLPGVQCIGRHITHFVREGMQNRY